MAVIEPARLNDGDTMHLANGWLEIADDEGVVGWRVPVNYVMDVKHEHYSSTVALFFSNNQGLELEADSRQDAVRIVEMAKQSDRLRQIERQARNAMIEAGQRKMVIGGLICAGGGIFTWISYSSAEPGSQYSVAIGALVFGALQFIYGAYQTWLG